MDMTKWLRQLGESKKPLPLLSFPGIRFLKGVNVRQMVTDSALQAACMKAVADRVDAAAAVSFMDLSVEAEAFGAAIEFFDDDVPAVIGTLVCDEEESEALAVPEVGAGRTGLYIDAIRLAKARITDRPVLAGAIGPFSLAGRLVDVSEAMYLCYDEPDMGGRELPFLIRGDQTGQRLRQHHAVGACITQGPDVGDGEPDAFL